MEILYNLWSYKCVYADFLQTTEKDNCFLQTVSRLQIYSELTTNSQLINVDSLTTARSYKSSFTKRVSGYYSRVFKEVQLLFH